MEQYLYKIYKAENAQEFESTATALGVRGWKLHTAFLSGNSITMIMERKLHDTISVNTR